MRKITFIFILLLFTFYFLLFTISFVSADELEEVEKKLSELRQALHLSIEATTPLEKNLSKLKEQLDDIRGRITAIEANVKQKEQQVREGEELLILAEELLSRKVRKFYIASSSFGNSGLLFLLNKNLADAIRQFGYRKSAIANDRDTIVTIVLYIKDLEEKKKNLESEQARLTNVKKETDEQAQFLEKEVAGAKEYQKQLSTKIAQLSARQKELLAQKLASLNLPTSLGAGPLVCTDDRKLDPGFSPAFAFFTFGIPHRVGMNQYGALGRAQEGQSYQDILRAYFEGISFEKRDPHLKIKVQGYGEKELDEYLLGVYEMPDNWPAEALKAQVVAARSYALSYTNNGEREICTTQQCQVYKGGNKGGNWEKAVKETEGEVTIANGQVITAWYASTFGGYTFFNSDVWGGSRRPWTKRMQDTSGDVGGFSDLFQKAYDRESPCFYAAQGWRSEYGKSAWLKKEEVADIVNVLLLAKSDPEVGKHLSQTDKPNPDGVETWNQDKVKQELRNRGVSPYNNIANISIDWDKGLGTTTQVNISGDAQGVSFNGDEFKNFFNLRVPANIQIVGPLYNVEKR